MSRVDEILSTVYFQMESETTKGIRAQAPMLQKCSKQIRRALKDAVPVQGSSECMFLVANSPHFADFRQASLRKEDKIYAGKPLFSPSPSTYELQPRGNMKSSTAWMFYDAEKIGPTSPFNGSTTNLGNTKISEVD